MLHGKHAGARKDSSEEERIVWRNYPSDRGEFGQDIIGQALEVELRRFAVSI